MPLPSRTPELRALDLLVSVAETGSLGRAAEAHGISQPAASMRIRALERQLRLVLLDRGPTGSRLTASGAAVVDWAVPVLAAARSLVGGVAALHADRRGRLRIAASMTVADHLVPGWLSALRGASPRTRVALRVGNSQQIARMVRGRTADVGFVESPEVPDGLDSTVVGEDELVVVVAPDHPWARRRRPLPLHTLAATPLVLREQGSGTRDATREVLAHAGELAPPAAELGSTTAIKAAVAAGEAPSVLSRLAVAAETGDRRLAEVRVDRPELLRRRFRAVWPPDAPPTGAAAALVRIATAAG
jgi:DNA-binding transcriptional LysR family regulator